MIVIVGKRHALVRLHRCLTFTKLQACAACALPVNQLLKQGQWVIGIMGVPSTRSSDLHGSSQQYAGQLGKASF
jgi:hypothetical protein